MYLKVLHTVLAYYIVCVVSMDDVYVYGQSSQEMLDQGRAQYQLLQERGSLPQYGSCWKNAIVHVNEGCRTLSDETQGEIALRLTNCFLQMSGHETYKCESDIKPNLRGICINSMSDRAFNVYTEFYTHTQNICWFLRGQIWHETIAESTFKVGKQLEHSVTNQERILRNQRESIELQEKLLKYGLMLEKIMEDFYLSTQQHQKILSTISFTLNSLQSWLLGEISWLDSLIFYVATGISILFFTCSSRTAGARLLCISLLTLNTGVERLICHWMSTRLLNDDIRSVHNNYNFYVWFCRYICLVFCLAVVFLKAYFYKDYVIENNILLQNVYSRVLSLSEANLFGQKVNLLNNNSSYVPSTISETCLGNESVSESLAENCNRLANDYESSKERVSSRYVYVTSRRQVTPLNDLQSGMRYNLRSGQGTPDLLV